ncbi:MAG: hypothetical protein AAB445_03295 [Patescibacteria group bacterium]
MDMTTLQQATELLKKSNTVLICLPHILSTDAVASGVALHLALTQQGKQAKVVGSNFTLPPTHAFLPKVDEIATDLQHLKKFVISLDTRTAPLAELSYDTTDGTLNILITPKSGGYTPSDVTTRTTEPTFDCAITLDCQDLDHLGPLFERNAEFFYATPIINIDHSPANEHFGQVNVVDIVATSVAEIVTDLVRGINPSLLNGDLATALLTGMIAKTKSFQTATVTPKVLSAASDLIAAGAKRDDIIRNLFQTKSLSVLKLWGRALARLRATDDGKLVWAVLNRADFERAGATPISLPGVLDELIVNTPDALIMAVLYEDPTGGVRALVQTQRSVNGLKLFASHQPEGTAHTFSWHLPNGTVTELETQLRTILQQLP